MFREHIRTDLLVFSDETSPSPAIAGVAAYEMEGRSHIHLFDIVGEAHRSPLGLPVSLNFLRVAARALDHFYPGSRLEDHGWHISNVLYSANIDFEPAGRGGYAARIKGKLSGINGVAPMSFYRELLQEGPYYTLGGIEEDLGALQRDVTHVRYIVPVQYAPHGLVVLGADNKGTHVPHVLDTARFYDGMVRDAMRREGVNSFEALTEKWQQQVRRGGEYDCSIPPISRCRDASLARFHEYPHDFYWANTMPEVYLWNQRPGALNLGSGREQISALFNLGAEFIPVVLMDATPEYVATAQTLWGLLPTCNQDFRADTVARMRTLPLVLR